VTIKTVQSLLSDIRLLDGGQYELVNRVRELVKQTISPVAEEVKYGGIVFSSGVHFCGVFAYKKHVSLELSHGALIADKFGCLEGAGKGRRHIKLYAAEDIEGKHLAHYLPLALAAAKAHA
jgi:hypothetical protein